MEFQTDLEDGKYMIAVKGRDASGNESGDKPLQLNFEVVSKNSIKNIYNYPNPFSTQTQFVYTLTGNVPNKMVLQIFTLTGKVVKEIALSDLELPRLGNNLTQFTWDGRDDYGSLLANGTYLFRIVAYDSNNSSYSGKATKNDFGKLVIIR
ncbi:MAG: hypothetical protein IPN72_18845 [Saprospiraceae bacterium]|nr:hypothetical protein [Saprospiraceae bacterium]